ncbi:MAG: hypothetical protein CEN88_278 [Candidatus Berkelbacteria bacterium Licking1014_2]|uniref:Uncharacterized protein n=1 Tax=Candidatus Berkelbacteria bacterium Licking1014_2 TaxID=2017146 RepID=A0A554LV64_9BACT|nr:MAG: hypothetical protein CEN88_278 [Candidatus Berkelbacteria bacterium Licking1014_2]
MENSQPEISLTPDFKAEIVLAWTMYLFLKRLIDAGIFTKEEFLEIHRAYNEGYRCGQDNLRNIKADEIANIALKLADAIARKKIGRWEFDYFYIIGDSYQEAFLRLDKLGEDFCRWLTSTNWTGIVQLEQAITQVGGLSRLKNQFKDWLEGRTEVFRIINNLDKTKFGSIYLLHSNIYKAFQEQCKAECRKAVESLEAAEDKEQLLKALEPLLIRRWIYFKNPENFGGLKYCGDIPKAVSVVEAYYKQLEPLRITRQKK